MKVTYAKTVCDVPEVEQVPDRLLHPGQLPWPGNRRRFCIDSIDDGHQHEEYREDTDDFYETLVHVQFPKLLIFLEDTLCVTTGMIDPEQKHGIQNKDGVQQGIWGRRPSIPRISRDPRF